MMPKIPFYKPSIGEDEIREVVDTLKSGWLTTGPKTKQFEREFGEYLGNKHAVAVNSCTAALHLALEAIGLKAGEGVIVPTMTFAATAEVVRYLGAQPMLVDCRAEDFNLDVADAEERIKSALAGGQSVTAIMPVHYGGQVGDVAGVRALAKRYNLKIVEDAAHCCPAYFRTNESEPWQPVGSGGDISCYSFYANKTITTGEGGMAGTSDDAYADRMRIMSLHGISRDAWKRYTAEGSWYYEIIAPGFKYNMSDIAAAIGIHQLRKAEALHRRRTALAQTYREALEEVQELILPSELPNRIHSWHLFVIRLKLAQLRIDRAQFISELQRRGIGTSVHWLPLHMHPYYRKTYGYVAGDLPMAGALYPELVTLPLYPDMSEEETAHVSNSIKEIVAANRRAAHVAVTKDSITT
jgi:dTDP-4-amino-4,6-dideoxygalactose transaminase